MHLECASMNIFFSLLCAQIFLSCSRYRKKSIPFLLLYLGSGRGGRKISRYLRTVLQLSMNDPLGRTYTTLLVWGSNLESSYAAFTPDASQASWVSLLHAKFMWARVVERRGNPPRVPCFPSVAFRAFQASATRPVCFSA